MEANLKVAREELEKLHSKSLFKVEMLSKKLSSEIGSCQRVIRDRETSFNQKLSILEGNLSKTAEDQGCRAISLENIVWICSKLFRKFWFYFQRKFSKIPKFLEIPKIILEV